MCEFGYPVRMWKRDLLEIFNNEPDFFSMHPASLEHWAKVINQIITQDKTAWQELLSTESSSHTIIYIDGNFLFNSILLN